MFTNDLEVVMLFLFCSEISFSRFSDLLRCLMWYNYYLMGREGEIFMLQITKIKPKQAFVGHLSDIFRWIFAVLKEFCPTQNVCHRTLLSTSPDSVRNHALILQSGTVIKVCPMDILFIKVINSSNRRQQNAIIRRRKFWTWRNFLGFISKVCIIKNIY